VIAAKPRAANASQRFIGNPRRVESDEHDFIMAGPPGADLLVGGVRGKAARVSSRRHVDTVAELPELALGMQSVPGYEMIPAIKTGSDRPGSASAAVGRKLRLRNENMGRVFREPNPSPPKIGLTPQAYTRVSA